MDFYQLGNTFLKYQKCNFTGLGILCGIIAFCSQTWIQIYAFHCHTLSDNYSNRVCAHQPYIIHLKTIGGLGTECFRLSGAKLARYHFCLSSPHFCGITVILPTCGNVQAQLWLEGAPTWNMRCLLSCPWDSALMKLKTTGCGNVAINESLVDRPLFLPPSGLKMFCIISA